MIGHISRTGEMSLGILSVALTTTALSPWCTGAYMYINYNDLWRGNAAHCIEAILADHTSS